METAAFHHQVERLATIAREASAEIDATLAELERVTILHDQTENPTRDFLDMKREALANAIDQMERIHHAVTALKDGLVAIV